MTGTQSVGKTEGLQPLDLNEFDAIRRQNSGSPELYQRLYLGLPKDFRNAVRALAAEAVSGHIGGFQGVEEAITAMRLLGTPDQKRLLSDSAVRGAISIALGSSSYQISVEMEQALDSVHDRAVAEIVSEWEPRFA